MSRRLAPAAGSARSFSHSPKPSYGTPATRLRVSSPARTRSTTTFGGVTYDVARQILTGHGRCAKIWPQLRLTKAWNRRAEARGSCRAFAGPLAVHKENGASGNRVGRSRGPGDSDFVAVFGPRRSWPASPGARTRPRWFAK